MLNTIYKSLIRLGNFDSNIFISNFDLNNLVDITNDFIKIYGGDYLIKNITDLNKFYKNWELIFKKSSKEYLEKSELVIDELIKDSRPYNENTLTTKHLNFNRYEFKDLFKKYITFMK